MIRAAHTGTTALSLKEISSPIRHHLGPFDEIFDKSIRSRIPLVDVVARYLIKRKGKKVRPILVLLSADLCGVVNERSYRAAALVEMLHTATLIHDDVIDEADTRRGFASINAIWKNKISILMGDYLLARGLLLCLDHDDFASLKITSTAVRRMSEGEIFQIQKSRKLDMDEETYFRIIADKTASLLATCCEIGAASTAPGPAIQTALRQYGEDVGMAFQIKDDLLDYVGRKSVTGKPGGLDLSDGKLTLPLIHALSNAGTAEGKKILGLMKNGKKMRRKDAGEIMEFAASYGGIDYAARRAAEFASSAKSRLAGFPESPSKTSLLQFADFVVERDR
jgi:octaprenyl-diphosphate synthase